MYPTVSLLRDFQFYPIHSYTEDDKKKENKISEQKKSKGKQHTRE